MQRDVQDRAICLLYRQIVRVISLPFALFVLDIIRIHQLVFFPHKKLRPCRLFFGEILPPGVTAFYMINAQKELNEVFFRIEAVVYLCIEPVLIKVPYKLNLIYTM